MFGRRCCWPDKKLKSHARCARLIATCPVLCPPGSYLGEVATLAGMGATR